MEFAEIDELYRSNLAAAKVVVFGGRPLVGEEITRAIQKAERSASALTKRQVGSADWARYTNESGATLRKFKNRGDKSATPFTKPKRSDHRAQVAQQRSDMDEYNEWQRAFVNGGPTTFRLARDS